MALKFCCVFKSSVRFFKIPVSKLYPTTVRSDWNQDQYWWNSLWFQYTPTFESQQFNNISPIPYLICNEDKDFIRFEHHDLYSKYSLNTLGPCQKIQLSYGLGRFLMIVIIWKTDDISPYVHLPCGYQFNAKDGTAVYTPRIHLENRMYCFSPDRQAPMLESFQNPFTMRTKEIFSVGFCLAT